MAHSTDTIAPVIVRSWVLPQSLREISAITIVPAGKIACLQNETGSIFIFNPESGEIDKEIPFGPPGDYRGIALAGNTAYIACADGRILEVANYLADTPKVTEHGTHLTVEETATGLCLDKRNRRLLVSIRGVDNASQHYKEIYSFNIAQLRMQVKPAIRIDLNSRVFRNIQPRNVQMIFQPSDLAINPANGHLYVVDGTRRQLLILNRSENIRELVEFGRENIQPEGITFTPSGELFIASKGGKEEPAKLLQIRIR